MTFVDVNENIRMLWKPALRPTKHDAQIHEANLLFWGR